MDRVFNNKKQKVFSALIFIVFFLMLSWAILFKFATRIESIPHYRGINLIPFYYDVETSTHLSEVLFNIFAFVPLGTLLAAFCQDISIKRMVLDVFEISFIFEMLQLIFGIGATDITDIICNTFGGALGIGLFYLIGKFTVKYRMLMINIVGTATETIGIAGIVLLNVANH